MADKVTTSWIKESIFESDNPSGHSVNMGLSDNPNDTNKPLSPKAAMLSSLAACSGLDIVSITDKSRAKFDDFKIIAEAELTEEHPKYYHTVSVEYHFYGKELNETKIKKAVDLSIEKYCGVMEMFRRFATVNTSIHYHNA